MPIALVIGAGASAPYGFPTGAGLRDQIISLTSPDQLTFSIQAGLRSLPGELEAFVYEFARSQMYSIDSFLARRREFEEIGKRAIAACILAKEAEPALFQSEPSGHWYRHLLNELCRDSIDNIALGKISVITFNYDRSLETYLLGAMQSAFKVPQPEAATALRELNIIHIYGALGNPNPRDTDYFAYGAEVSPNTVARAASGIRIIPEGRDDDPNILLARQRLSEATAVAFLGFGFDRDNPNRLNTRETCLRIPPMKDGRARLRNVYATCRGMTRAEAFRAFEGLGQTLEPNQTQDGLPPRFYDADCLSLLRETLLLDVA